uniref:Uncharacterized protein n=1 Tax=Parascaris equorum TaxID=6256 RepID=A0A914RH73_PAREQ
MPPQSSFTDIEVRECIELFISALCVQNSDYERLLLSFYQSIRHCVRLSVPGNGSIDRSITANQELRARDLRTGVCNETPLCSPII